MRFKVDLMAERVDASDPYTQYPTVYIYDFDELYALMQILVPKGVVLGVCLADEDKIDLAE